MERIKLFFDCDTGIDDALALGYLLAGKEKVDLVGIGSVCGNIDAASGARNSLDLLNLAGFTFTPVAEGERDYSHAAYHCVSQHIHGQNGIGDIRLTPAPRAIESQTAAEMLISLARQYPGELHVLATGPLTNIAKALQLAPELPELIARLTIMGGAALVPGNRTPVAEANIAGDPQAAAAVFRAFNNIVMVPLDVTLSHKLTEEHRLQLLNSGKPFAHALGAMLEIYIDFYEKTYGTRACAIHDPAAAYFAIEGLNHCLAPKVKVVVDDTQGPGRGQTICDMRGMYKGYPVQQDANCQVVLKTDIDLASVLMDKLMTL